MSKVDFTGRVVVITGAGGGLGRTYAHEIAKRGGAVVANDLGGNVDGENPSPSMADKVVSDIVEGGGRAVASYDSVTTMAGAQAIIDKALSAFGRVDAVINNAGTLNNDWFEDVPETIRDGLWATHLGGTWNVTQAAWPHMKKAKYGRVLITSSGAGMFGNQTQAAYGAAKAGSTGLMNVLAQEGKAHNILVNVLLPNASSRMGEKMKPEEMAPAAKYLAEIGNAVTPPFITGLAVYLVSEQCSSTHELYSALGGRLARAFIGVTEGWFGPIDAPPSADDVAAHIDEIRDTSKGFHIPSSLLDEMRIVSEQYAKKTHG
jgi:NAD(P)-dependent dehydrogenase (short-subunit alcohol dehydrogenase family)